MSTAEWQLDQKRANCYQAYIDFCVYFEFCIQVNTVDCIRFMTRKTVFKKMMDLDAEEMVFVMKIIDLNAEVFAEKIIVALVFEINGGGIYTVMALIN